MVLDGCKSFLLLVTTIRKELILKGLGHAVLGNFVLFC